MIVVTTPTGDIGHQLVQALLDGDEPVRVIARDPSRLAPGVRERVEVVEGSHGDPDVVAKAFAGADSVFWLVPPNPRAQSLDAAYLDFTRPAAEAFVSAGVQRVVGVSALGRGTGVSDHAGLVTVALAMDDLIASTGVGYRALTMPSFMDNVLRQVKGIKDDGVLFGTLTADRPFPTCATRDIAATAAALLRDHSWDGQGHVAVLGPENLSFDQLAQIISEVLERPVRYQRIPVEAYAAQLTGFGMSAAMVQGMVDMMVAKDAGLDDAEPRTPESTTPTSFRQWCEEVLKPAVLAA